MGGLSEWKPDSRRGRRAITADTALRLARYFGTSPNLWMNLQRLMSSI